MDGVDFWQFSGERNFDRRHLLNVIDNDKVQPCDREDLDVDLWQVIRDYPDIQVTSYNSVIIKKTLVSNTGDPEDWCRTHD